MDDQKLGWTLRGIRIRKRWRQEDLAARAGFSRWLVMRIERGRLNGVPLGKLRAAAETLDARVDVHVRWQGGDLDRLINARHALMHEVMTTFFRDLGGWVTEPEVSFSIWGERGIIDILAWHPTNRILLIIELKTELVDISELLGTHDRKRRLAAKIGQDRGHEPTAIGTWVVLADSRTNRRAVASHAATLRTKLPTDGRGIESWLKAPKGAVDALSFLPSVQGMHLRGDAAPVKRVVRRRTPTIERVPSTE